MKSVVRVMAVLMALALVLPLIASALPFLSGF